MKKLLALVLVLSVAGIASATTVGLMGPADLVPGVNKIYLTLDVTDGIGSLAAEITASAGGVFVAAMEPSNCEGYGIYDKGADAFGMDPGVFTEGGWQEDLSSPAVGVGTAAVKIAAAHSGSEIFATDIPGWQMPVGFVDFDWDGSLPVTIGLRLIPEADGDPIGNTADAGGIDMVAAGIMTGAPLVYVPEPITMTLLGLGGLFAVRRRR